MSDRRSSRIVEEAIRRSGIKAPAFSAKDYCFDKQYSFINSKARFKTAVCSRRAGKTIGIAADLLETAQNIPDTTSLYITLTSRNARSILWPDLLRLVEDKKIELAKDPDNTRLELLFPNRSRIVLGGAKDEAEIEKYRGWKLKKAYIDEAQSFRPYIKNLIDDILLPALRDLRGSLALTGTPGPVPAGPFFDIAHSKGWEHHKWTAFDNPHMKDLDAVLAEERAVKGIDENDPGYIRETYGRWIEDFNSLVFKFNSSKNIYEPLPQTQLSDMDFIFGIDIGYEDSDAIAVLGYSYTDRNVYLVEEFIKNKMTISELVGHINRLREKYQPVKMVMDAGALGKKIQMEIQDRHGLYIEAAEKTRKLEFIELLNDDLRTGRFKAFENSRFQQDSLLVQWDRSVTSKRKISDIYHSDITDAVLYGWRECRHYFAKPEADRPKPGTPEYFAMVDREQEEREEQQAKRAASLGTFDEIIDLESKEFWED